MLSREDVDRFRTFGFVILRNYLSAEEIDQLRKEFDRAMEVAFVGNEFDGSTRHWIPMLGPAAPTFGKLAGDRRFLEGGQDLSGGDTVLFTVDANQYVGDTGWHSDGAPSRSVKFVFYLEPVAAETGALRVIPTSHRATPHVSGTGVSEEIKEQIQARVNEVNATGDYRAIPAVPLESEPGDVVVFDPHIFHAAVGGRPGRPMCTVTYFPLPAEGESVATQVSPSQHDSMFILGATDVTEVFDLDWFASQDWGEGHSHVIDNLRRVGALPSSQSALLPS